MIVSANRSSFDAPSYLVRVGYACQLLCTMTQAEGSAPNQNQFLAIFSAFPPFAAASSLLYPGVTPGHFSIYDITLSIAISI